MFIMVQDNNKPDNIIQNLELAGFAEVQFLGSLLIEGGSERSSELLEEVRNIVSPEDFTDAGFKDNRHSVIYQAMLDSGKTDQLSVAKTLADTGKDYDMNYLYHLISQIGTSIDCIYYAEQIADLASQRRNGRRPVDDISSTFEYERTLTDLGNAERLVALYGNKIRYCYERNSWLVFTGKQWMWDNGDKIREMAKKTARNIYMEAAAEPDDKRRDDLVKHAKQSEGNMRIKGMIELAQSSVPITISDLNKDQYLLNVNNGTINLKNGELQPHAAADYITFLIPIDYVPEAESELWQVFLSRIFEDNIRLIEYIQKSFGYAVTGNQDEQALWFFCGTGANGKTTLTGVIRDVLGDYAIEIDPLAFGADKNARAGPNESIASLYNKRFAASTEVKTGMPLDVALIKRMTGGEQLRCERKFEHGFNFLPTHKLFLSGNHEPRISDTTNSIWNRLKYVPFNMSIPEDERIKGLRHTLSREHAGAVLTWLVEGCLKWQNEGLSEPPEVKVAVQSYRDSQDILHDFITEWCLIQPGETITVKDLYSAYKSWADNNDIDKPIGKNTFNNRMKEKNFRTELGHARKLFWRSIRLMTDEEKEIIVESNQNSDSMVTLVTGNLESSQEKSRVFKTFGKTSNQSNQSNQANPGEIPEYPEQPCSTCNQDAWGLKPDGSGYYCTNCEKEENDGRTNEKPA